MPTSSAHSLNRLPLIVALNTMRRADTFKMCTKTLISFCLWSILMNLTSRVGILTAPISTKRQREHMCLSPLWSNSSKKTSPTTFRWRHALTLISSHRTNLIALIMFALVPTKKWLMQFVLTLGKVRSATIKLLFFGPPILKCSCCLKLTHLKIWTHALRPTSLYPPQFFTVSLRSRKVSLIWMVPLKILSTPQLLSMRDKTTPSSLVMTLSLDKLALRLWWVTTLSALVFVLHLSWATTTWVTTTARICLKIKPSDPNKFQRQVYSTTPSRAIRLSILKEKTKLTTRLWSSTFLSSVTVSALWTNTPLRSSWTAQTLSARTTSARILCSRCP